MRLPIPYVHARRLLACLAFFLASSAPITLSHVVKGAIYNDIASPCKSHPNQRLSGNVTFASAPDGGSRWDFKFISNVYLATSGANITIQGVVLVNTRFSKSNDWPLAPRAITFDATPGTLPAQLSLTNVTISTTCDYVWYGVQLVGMSREDLQQDPSGVLSLSIQKLSKGNVQIQGLTLSCRLPQLAPQQLQEQQPSATYLISSAADMMNAMVAAQSLQLSPTVTLLLINNISFSDIYSEQADVHSWIIGLNVSVKASQAQQTVIDWNLMNWIFSMKPGFNIKFTDIFLMNLSPVRSLVIPRMGYLPLYATPLWIIWPRTTNQIILDNSTLLLSIEEYQYLLVLTAVVSIQVPVINMQAANGLKANFEIKLPLLSEQSRDPNIIRLSLLAGNGIRGTNLWITSKAPSAFPALQPHTDVPNFRLDPNSTYPDVNQVGCYSACELMTLLGALEAAPLDEGLGIVLYRNISLRDVVQLWPEEGYKLRSEVYLVGRGMGVGASTLDFGLVPSFVNASRGVKVMLFYLNLLNLYGGAAAGSGQQRHRARSLAAQAGLPAAMPFITGDVSVSYSRVVIPYADFKALQQVATGQASLASIPQLSTFNVSSSSATSVTLSYGNFSGVSYQGASFTYLNPPGVNFSILCQ